MNLQIRRVSDISILEWIYIAISVISILGSLVLAGERIAFLRSLYSCKKYNGTTHQHHNHESLCEEDDVKADYTFAILMFWTGLFSLYHVIIGIVSARVCDIFVFMASTLIVWAYVLSNSFLVVEVNRTDAKLVRLIMVSVAAPLIIGIGIVLCRRYITSNRLLFSVPEIGGNQVLQKSFLALLVHDSLLKFDVQMGVSVLILWVQESFIENAIDFLELVVISTGLAVTVFWVIIAYLAIRLENNCLVYTFYASSLIEPAVVILNMVRMASPSSIPWASDQVFHASKPLVWSAYACGLLALLSRFCTVVSMVIVQRNFGKGLKSFSKYGLMLLD